jgi:hypothetical protein
MIAYDSISSMIQPAVDKDTISLIRLCILRIIRRYSIDRYLTLGRRSSIYYFTIHTYIYVFTDESINQSITT